MNAGHPDSDLQALTCRRANRVLSELAENFNLTRRLLEIFIRFRFQQQLFGFMTLIRGDDGFRHWCYRLFPAFTERIGDASKISVLAALHRDTVAGVQETVFGDVVGL